jgi:hypothetical protein
MTPEENLKVKSLTDRADIFKYVVDHLRKQGCQSLVDHEGNCAYRGKGGAMCAVGVLIADDEYDPTWEGSGIDQLVEKSLLPPPLMERIKQNLEMLIDLQNLHDACFVYDDGDSIKINEADIEYLRKKWNIK